MTPSELLKEMGRTECRYPIMDPEALGNDKIWQKRWKALMGFLELKRVKSTTRLAIRCADIGAAANVGGPVDERTFVFDVESEDLVRVLAAYKHQWGSISTISLVEEVPNDRK